MCIKYGCDSPETLAWYRFGVRLRRPAHLLARAFPPPTGLNDEEHRAWVRQQRQNWLSGNYDAASTIFQEHGDVFEAIRLFITGN